MSGAVERTRRMTFELRPAVLWQNGLEAALRQLLRPCRSESEMQVDASRRWASVERLDETLETIAFRSIAELTTQRAQPLAGRRGSSITLAPPRAACCRRVVADDGRGFDLEQALSRARVTNHLGLEAMMERIDAAGGIDHDRDRRPARGTRPGSACRVRPGYASAASAELGVEVDGGG